MDEANIRLDPEDVKRIEEKYTAELAQKATQLISTYTMRIERDAKKIIDTEGYRDTGRLINSIKPSLKAYAAKVTGEVNAGTEYARFIHEGAKHESDTKTVRHFVRFKTAPSLFTWAKRNGIIQQIRGDWYFIDKNNHEHLISDINKSGLMVYARPTKFFEKPFESVKEQFVAETSRLVGGTE